VKKKIKISKNIYLRLLNIHDINENYFNWFKDSEIKNYIEFHRFKSLKQLKKYFLEIKKKKYLLFYGIFYKNLHIGNIKFENIYDNSDKAGFGILIGNKKFRNKGYGKIIISFALEYIINKYKIKEFIISANEKNLLAKKLYQNLGFVVFKKKDNKIHFKLKTLYSKFILGSANFNNTYGINNSNLQKFQIKKIFKILKRHNIEFIDTAINYGNSEKIIGRYAYKNLKIISKFPSISNNISVEKNINKMILNSLSNTRQNRLYAYLFHEPKDIFSKNGKKIINHLKKFKKNKKINKIGVSVYNKNELNRILKIFTPDLVQLPVSLINQNFIKKNYLKKLKKKNIELHARSIFLQGLLLKKNIKHLNNRFCNIDNKLRIADNFCKKIKIKRLNLMLNFVSNINEIDKIVVGADNSKDLREIFKSFKILQKTKNLSQFSLKNEKITDPRNWK